MNKMNISDDFTPAATQVSNGTSVERQRGSESELFDRHYDRLFKALSKIAKKTDSLDKKEPEIRQAFRRFLTDMHYPMALKNFDSLLHEKSGKNFKRLDGTVNWYHEFIPLLTHFAIFRLGKDQKGIDVEDLKEHGGLEVFISSTLRHDSTEDHTKPQQFRRMQLRKLNEVRHENPGYDAEAARENIEHMLNNNRLISQPFVIGPNGEKIKEDAVLYCYRMITDPRATPHVFIQKLGDNDHNFATFYGVPKFTPEKRLKRCDEREDMYGRRYGFTDMAIKKWPNYAEGIKTLDAIMGVQLYPSFRYLQKVDLHYKKPYDIPVSIEPYLERALSLELPDPKFNMIHMGMKRMMDSVDPRKEPEKYIRLQEHIELSIKPALEDYKEHFPYLFKAAGNNPQPVPSPVA